MNNTNNNRNNTERQTYQNRPAQSPSAQRPTQTSTPRPSRPAGSPQQTQSAQRSASGTQSAQTPVSRPAGYSQQPKPIHPRASSGANDGRLSAEERRRIEAARLAAMNSVKRMSEEEEYSLRRMEQEYLEAEQPKITRTAQNRAQNQPREEERAPAAAYRRKKHVKINWGAILIILITVSVIGVSAWQMIKNPMQLPNDGGGTNIGDVGGENETNPPISDGTGEGETEPPADIPLVMYDTRIHLNKYVDVGHQILVNNDRKYERVDSVETINAYSSRTYFTNEHIGQSVRLKVSGTSLGMDEKAFRALEAMYAGLVADTGCDDLLITSGYRTVADQQGIWDRNLAQSGEDYTRSYVAIPGHSEHHTGLACDLSFYTDAGATIPLVDHEYGSWIWENCSDYGFILRYLKDKEDITHIAYEPWHFRYVGFPHAKAVEHFDVCFEEYIELIKKYTFETRMLYVKSDGTVSGADPEEMPTSDGYLIYYVPMAEGESTQIKIPAGFEYEDITISGNNVDGFIVTVYLYSSES